MSDEMKKLKEQKDIFVGKFIRAMQEKSNELCLDLMMPFEVYTDITGDRDITEESYIKGQKEQIQGFFRRNEVFFLLHKSRIKEAILHNSFIRGLGDCSQITNKHAIQNFEVFHINIGEQILENKDISYIRFKIDFANFINNVLFIQNMHGIEVEEYIQNPPIPYEVQYKKILKLGFREIQQEEYLKTMKGQGLGNSDYYKNHIWFLYDGDLTIEEADIAAFDLISVIITGDLTIKGVLNYQEISTLFVLGDVTADSIFLLYADIFFKGITQVKNTLISMAGDGAAREISMAHGPFIYSEAEGTNIKASKKHSDVFIDTTYGENFGNIINYIHPDLYEIEDEDGEEIILLDCDATLKRLLTGKSIRV